jgi:hypothetical protein
VCHTIRQEYGHCVCHMVVCMGRFPAEHRRITSRTTHWTTGRSLCMSYGSMYRSVVQCVILLDIHLCSASESPCMPYNQTGGSHPVHTTIWHTQWPPRYNLPSVLLSKSFFRLHVGNFASHPYICLRKICFSQLLIVVTHFCPPLSVAVLVVFFPKTDIKRTL